jgi:uncharacterized membrane protein YdjX (TVP38/TMEM64 family)
MSRKPTAAQKKALLIKLAAALAVVGIAALLVLRGLDLRALLEETLALIRELGPWAFFGGMAVLPAFGFPLSPFWLGAAPVFAAELGLPLVILLAGAGLFVNLVLTYWLARYALRPPLAWLVRRLGYELPEVSADNHVTVSVLVRVTPGPPFFMQSYLLGLAEIPFRIYLLVSWPIAMAMGIGVIFFGDSLAHGKGKLALLALAGLVALAVGFKLLRLRMMKAKREAAQVAAVAVAVPASSEERP